MKSPGDLADLSRNSGRFAVSLNLSLSFAADPPSSDLDQRTKNGQLFTKKNRPRAARAEL
jgi:hypothetical protein